jgi:hypothetical protein
MTALDVAIDFLKDLLANAPMRASEVIERAKSEHELARATVYRAKEALKIVTVDGKWSLPYRGEET